MEAVRRMLQRIEWRWRAWRAKTPRERAVANLMVMSLMLPETALARPTGEDHT